MKSQYILIILLAFASCKEADLPTPESENIIGEWEWVQSFGGNAGDLITPQSSGSKELLEIKDNSRYKKYINDKKESSGKWTIEVSDEEYADYIIDFGDNMKGRSWATFSGKDTLSLYLEGCRDCRTSTYVRK